MIGANQKPIKHEYVRRIRKGMRLIVSYDEPETIVVDKTDKDSILVTNVYPTHPFHGRDIVRYPTTGKCVLLKKGWDVDPDESNIGDYFHLKNYETGEKIRVHKIYLDVKSGVV